jgi:hypothetical protein
VRDGGGFNACSETDFQRPPGLKPRAIPFLQKNRKRPRSRTDCLCIIFRAPSFRLFPGERVGNLEPEDTKSCGQGPN